MAKGKNAEKKWGWEYWSRRPYFGEGRWGKTMTHRAERRQAKKEVRRGDIQ